MRRLSFIISPTHPDYEVFERQSSKSREIYNMVNSIARTIYFHNSTIDFGEEIYFIAKQYGYDVENNNPGYNYMGLMSIAKFFVDKGFFALDHTFGTKALQQTIRLLAQNWTSYWGLWRKHKTGAYLHKPKIPGYVKDYQVVTYNSQMIGKTGLKNNQVIPTPTSVKTGVELPDDIDPKTVLSARLIPRAAGEVFELEVLYKNKEKPQHSGDITAGIDIGIDNLYTIAFDDFSEGTIVSGKSLKHINQSYNYHIDSYNSRLSKHSFSKKTRKKNTWFEKRRRKLYHEYTTINSATVKHLIDKNVGTVIIGWNKEMKTNSNMGRRNNRSFVSLPHKKIVDNLVFKLQEIGINVILVEESYTSQSSFIDNDILPSFDGKHKKYAFSGKRKTRGLYITKHGCRINADANGALNIIKKHVPGFCFSADPTVKDAVVYPVHTLDTQSFHKHLSR